MAKQKAFIFFPFYNFAGRSLNESQFSIEKLYSCS